MNDDPPRLYTQRGRADSARVRRWLVERGVSFVERNVTADPAAARELAATGLFATPLVVVGHELVLGYRPEALRGGARCRKGAGMTVTEETLSPIERRVHRVLLEGFLATGVVPSLDDLADAAGIDVVELPGRLAALEAADYLARDPSSVVTCLYPFSPIPTPHVVVVGGHRRHAMCSIDALGTAAMLCEAVAIESSCAECGAPIRLDVSPGTIARAKPPDSVAPLVRRSGDEPACDTCCPFTLFACEPAHGEALAARLPETIVVSLDEALRHGESIFGDMFSETLPGQRRRSRLTSSRLWT